MELIWHFIVSFPGQAHWRGKGGLGPASEQALSEEPCPSSGVFQDPEAFPSIFVLLCCPARLAF